jgi:excisionase family DNA binding protein
MTPTQEHDEDAPAVTMTRRELKELMREVVREAAVDATPAANREFLTPDQLARRLGMHPKSLRTLVSRDGLPSHTLGPKLVRFLWSEVEQWAMERGKNLESFRARAGRSHLSRVPRLRE